MLSRVFLRQDILRVGKPLQWLYLDIISLNTIIDHKFYNGTSQKNKQMELGTYDLKDINIHIKI